MSDPVQKLSDKAYLVGLMQSYQRKCVALLQSGGFVVPEFQHLVYGIPSWDVYPALMVGCTRAFNSAPGIRPDVTRLNPKGARNPAVGLSLTVLRQAITLNDVDGQVPDHEALDDEAEAFYTEAWNIWQGVDEAVADETVFSIQPYAGWAAPEFNTMQMGDLKFLGPNGAIAGYEVPIVVSLGL